MSEMVERVAKAMVADATKGFTSEEKRRGAEVLWPHYADLARAAIAAMREPTDASVSAGGDVMTKIEEVARAVQKTINELGEGYSLEMARVVARAAIQALGLGWRPIESAPREGWIMGYTSWGRQAGKLHEHVGPCEWCKNHFEFTNTDFDVFPLPTHWQPLPEPPGDAALSEEK